MGSRYYNQATHDQVVHASASTYDQLVRQGYKVSTNPGSAKNQSVGHTDPQYPDVGQHTGRRGPERIQQCHWRQRRPGNNSAGYSGAAYIFVRSGTNWTQQAYLKASNRDIGDEFGDQ